MIGAEVSAGARTNVDGTRVFEGRGCLLQIMIGAILELPKPSYLYDLKSKYHQLCSFQIWPDFTFKSTTEK